MNGTEISSTSTSTPSWNILSFAVTDLFLASNLNPGNESSSSLEVYLPTTAPPWMVEFVAFRKRLFLWTVEPIIVLFLGPVEEEKGWTNENLMTTAFSNSNNDEFHNETDALHRRLGFLPAYVENASTIRDTSMSFATLVTLFVTMSCILLIFLSCFYHNQKTSPLFSSPRRHRLPKLVPPPLPIGGYFDWVRSSFRTRATILFRSYR